MDRSFVAPVVEDERSRMIVQTTSQMARALGLRFVAEGVEDAVAMARWSRSGSTCCRATTSHGPCPRMPCCLGCRHWNEIQLSSRLH